MSEKQPLLQHLAELRNRLLWCALFFGVAFAVCYIYAAEIYAFLAMPLAGVIGNQEGARLIYTSLTEAFMTYVRVAAWAAFCLSCPFILIQIWRFVAPGLYDFEQRAVRPFLIMTPVLFVAGAALAYYLVIPLAWQYFAGFEAPGGAGALPVMLETKMSEYLSLTMGLLFAFGIAFEAPVVLLLLLRIGVLQPQDLASRRRYAVVVIFIVAAILTPPDPLSQTALALPLILLYEGVILYARIAYKNLRPTTPELPPEFPHD